MSEHTVIILACLLGLLASYFSYKVGQDNGGMWRLRYKALEAKILNTSDEELVDAIIKHRESIGI